MTRQLKLMTLVCAALGLMACGSSSDGAEGSSGGETAYAGPIASTDTAAGQAVYETYCNTCHPDGGEARGPAIRDEHESAAIARQQVREGGDHMPAFPPSRISADDLESLLAYMVTLGAVQDTASGTP